MTLLLDFDSCYEVDATLLDQAFDVSGAPVGVARDRVMRLLERMARIAKPRAGAYRIFEVIARLARSGWLTGPLDIVIRDFGIATEIDLRIDEGSRFSRLRTLSLAVPLDELSAWIHQNPGPLAPLGVFGPSKSSELRLRIVETAADGGNQDVHSRDTSPNQMLSLPKEAYRPKATRPEHRPTARIPVVKPLPPKPDRDDEGWE